MSSNLTPEDHNVLDGFSQLIDQARKAGMSDAEVDYIETVGQELKTSQEKVKSLQSYASLDSLQKAEATILVVKRDYWQLMGRYSELQDAMIQLQMEKFEGLKDSPPDGGL